MLHLANSDFEFELERDGTLPLRTSLEQNPITLQLQFLPFLMEGNKDQVITTQLAKERPWLSLPGNTPEGTTLDNHSFSSSSLAMWGASEAVRDWATKRGLEYYAPSKEIVATVHSKVFSFTHSPQLPGSRLLYSEKELSEWRETHPGPGVLKSAFGVSARGHLLLSSGQPPASLKPFCEGEWKMGRPLIAEPWVERLADFSSQWAIDQAGTIHEIGFAELINDRRGGYSASRVGKLSPVITAALGEHREVALRLLTKMAGLGYFGPVGIDAMLYRWKGKTHLHPVVEVNARKTMSLVAIKLQQAHFPDEQVTITYRSLDRNLRALLPHQLGTQRFKRQLYLY